MVEDNGFITNHQFSFRERHYRTQQTHQIVQKIYEVLENKQYCSAAFLYIPQAFDKVWHTGLLYQLRLFLPLNYFILLKPYLHSRHFVVTAEPEHTKLSTVNADVSQSSVLRTLLYMIYTIDLKISTEFITRGGPPAWRLGVALKNPQPKK
jgi:hypothetical protein